MTIQRTLHQPMSVVLAIRHIYRVCSAIQSQTAVTAYFPSKQLLMFAFVQHDVSLPHSTFISLTFYAYMTLLSVQLMFRVVFLCDRLGILVN